ncbi:MAG: SBBP repeat-containing protein [Acidobacteria bacterium]|nr:SBBP repeat-containing protein [Acidobacteriota bacterium]
MLSTSNGILKRAYFYIFLLTVVAMAQPVSAEAQTIEWIDQWGTFLEDNATGVAVDATGVYASGIVLDDPPGAPFPFPSGTDGVVTKYDTSGNVLWQQVLASAPIGTTIPNDTARGVAVDASGIYVVGNTRGTLPGQASAGDWDGFVIKYDTNGTEQWIRQIGTSEIDFLYGVATDAGGGIYVAGLTNDVLPNQASAGGSDVFVRKYNASGNEQWTRQFGSTSDDVAWGLGVNATGVYVVGQSFGALPGQTSAGGADAFMRKYDANGTELWTHQFGTFASEEARGIAADATAVYVVGWTNGALPGQTSAGGQDAFVRKYDASGTELWTRQFGSESNFVSQRSDQGLGVALGFTGVYVVGHARGTFPGQVSAGGFDAYVRKYDLSGGEAWTHQFGSANNDQVAGVAVNSTGVYLAGDTFGTLPGEASAGGRDMFVAKLLEPGPPGPAISDGGVVNHASFAPSPAPVAPGSIAAVYGTNLNDGSSVWFSSFGPDGKLVTTLGGASVTINDIPAPLFYSTPSQLGIQIPFELAGQTSATIIVTVGGQSSVPRTINLDVAAPGIFTLSQNGAGTAAALHEDGVRLVTAENPARPNEVVTFFATGFGALTPPLATGAPATENRTLLPTSVYMDGIPCFVVFSRAVPGFVGLYEIGASVPLNIRTDPAIPVDLRISDKQSNMVTIPTGP